METLANAAPIILNGAEWYRQFGTEKSAGTKVFALAGDIINAGIIAVSYTHLDVYKRQMLCWSVPEAAS